MIHENGNFKGLKKTDKEGWDYVASCQNNTLLIADEVVHQMMSVFTATSKPEFSESEGGGAQIQQGLKLELR